MTGLLHIMHIARERGWLGAEERLQLQGRYYLAWVVFCEVLGDDLANARAPMPITSAQLDEIEKTVEKVYATPLGMHRLREAFRQCAEDVQATFEQARKALSGQRLKG